MKPLINFKKLIITIWILLWVILFMLVIGKLLFHRWYPIVINNTNVFIWIDNHIVIRYIINYIFYFINCYFSILTSTKKKRPTVVGLFTIILTSIICNTIKIVNNNIGILFELLCFICIPVLYNLHNNTFGRILLNILVPVITNALTAFWQLNILFIRDINELLVEMPTVISYTLQIDYYIFLIITWMGVVYIMSTLGLWFFGKSQLEAMKAKELSKENPDMEYIAKTDKEIAKRNEE